MIKPDRILLASASPRRRELLAGLGLEFEAYTTNVEEFEDPLANPAVLVKHNARLKACAIVEKYPEALIIGSDTTVSYDQKILGKPVNMEQAHEMIRRLSGAKHTVYTGLSLICLSAGIDETHVVSSDVIFKVLSDEDINRYFQIVNPLDKAGAYGIQEGRDIIIESYEGSLSNVMGLPMELLIERLKAFSLL